MKKTILSLCLLAAFAAHAQDSTANSAAGSNSGSTSTSGAAAIGNINASRSDSASQSGAQSGSLSGAVGNTVIFNPSSAGATAQGAGGIPTTRFINEQSGTSRNESVLSGGTVNRTTLDGTTTANENQNLSGGTTNRNTNTDNINYSGTIDNKSSGGTYNVLEQRGTTTVKMAPAIAMSGPASGPCTGQSGGIGLSGPGWGLGLNGSAVMDDCRMRENTRVLGMAMQSLDGVTNPQEKGEVTVIFMDAVRALGQYNQSIYAAQKAK